MDGSIPHARPRLGSGVHSTTTRANVRITIHSRCLSRCVTFDSTVCLYIQNVVLHRYTRHQAARLASNIRTEVSRPLSSSTSTRRRHAPCRTSAPACLDRAPAPLAAGKRRRHPGRRARSRTWHSPGPKVAAAPQSSPAARASPVADRHASNGSYASRAPASP